MENRLWGLTVTPFTAASGSEVSRAWHVSPAHIKSWLYKTITVLGTEVSLCENDQSCWLSEKKKQNTFLGVLLTFDHLSSSP